MFSKRFSCVNSNVTKNERNKREHMKKYKNLGKNSSVIAFEEGEDYINIQFENGWIYKYSAKSAGMFKVDMLKMFANRGMGLNEYITHFAYKDYERKYRGIIEGPVWRK